MSVTLKKIRTRPHVAFVDDERELGNSIVVTLEAGYCFAADPGCGVRGFDTITEAEVGTRASQVNMETTRRNTCDQMASHEQLKDSELVEWALKHGWAYFSSNDQLRDPQGFMTTAGNWDAIGPGRREQIIKQMRASGA